MTLGRRVMMAGHQAFFAGDYLFRDLLEVWLRSDRVQHILNMVIINFLVELHREDAVARFRELLDQLCTSYFFFLVVNQAAVHFGFENVSCHGDVGAVVARFDDLGVFVVGDLFHLVVCDGGEPLTDFYLGSVPFVAAGVLERELLLR